MKAAKGMAAGQPWFPKAGIGRIVLCWPNCAADCHAISGGLYTHGLRRARSFLVPTALSKARVGQHEREGHGFKKPALSEVEGCRWERGLIIRDEGAASADEWPILLRGFLFALSMLMAPHLFGRAQSRLLHFLAEIPGDATDTTFVLTRKSGCACFRSFHPFAKPAKNVAPTVSDDGDSKAGTRHVQREHSIAGHAQRCTCWAVFANDLYNGQYTFLDSL